MPVSQGAGIDQQQPAGQGGLDVGQRRRQQRVGQPALGAPGHHGGQAQQRLCSGAQRCEAGPYHVLHAARHGRRRHGGVAQQFGDEEGIALRGRVQAVAAAAGALGQRLHRRRAQAWHGQVAARGRWQFTENAAQRMGGADLVVAKAHCQQGVRALDASAQVLQQVLRGVVGPVGVFHHEQQRLGGQAQFVDHGLEQRRPRGRPSWVGLVMPAPGHGARCARRRLCCGPARNGLSSGR